jgi:hypothetical protein
MREGSQIEAERSSIERAIAAIERYVALHPSAADNAQGIAQWWLPEMGVDLPIELVHRALEQLWQCGVLERNVLPDGGAVYRGAKRTDVASVDQQDQHDIEGE